MEYYSSIKKNELLVYALTWINFQRIRLSKEKPTAKGTTV